MIQHTMPETLLIWVPQSDSKSSLAKTKILRKFNEFSREIFEKGSVSPNRKIRQFMRSKEKRLHLRPLESGSRAQSSHPESCGGKLRALYWTRFLEKATFDKGKGDHVGQVTVIRATRVS